MTFLTSFGFLILAFASSVIKKLLYVHSGIGKTKAYNVKKNGKEGKESKKWWGLGRMNSNEENKKKENCNNEKE